MTESAHLVLGRPLGLFQPWMVGLKSKKKRFVVRFPLSVGFEALFFGLFVVSFNSLCRVTGPAPTSWLGGLLPKVNQLTGIFVVRCCPSPLRIAR